MKNKIYKFYIRYIDEKKTLKDNYVFALLIFTPATLISSILVIPLIIIALPFLIFPRNVQDKVTKFLLYIQHSVSLSCFYVFEEVAWDYFFNDIIWPDSFNYMDVVYGSLFAFVFLYRSIKQMVGETMQKMNKTI